MKTAQIWKSIEALNDEAEAALKSGLSVIAVIKSVQPPAFVLKKQIDPSKLVIHISNPAPPTAKLAKKHKNSNASTEPPLSSFTMDEIAAAIDRASKEPKTTCIDLGEGQISNDFRQELLMEVEKAVRLVLVAELPQLVRYAVSVSMHELLATSKTLKEQKTKAADPGPIAGAKPK